MSPSLQLEFPLFDIEPIEAGQIVAVEAAIRTQERGLHDRSARAGRPRPCRCERPWTFRPGACTRCGRELTHNENGTRP
jgi:hypothetical protein